MVTISLDDLTVNNVGVLEKINEVTLPTSYSKDFYKTALDAEQFVKIAYYSEIPVGAIKAKLVVPPHHSSPTAVYIESLGVLKPYRHQGIGNQLVEYIVDQARKSFVHQVIVHVWIENKEALEWYKKLGFEVKETLEDYYKDHKLSNPTAIVLLKSF